ncbi:hypothetical protein QE152_g18170 [Popillia japonica]|uniref:DUF4806 domain-containing protein n=1 Tax=Popillia japonica TaxID=7064 RepID=A0AAW1L4M5_POPJA
MTFLDYGVNNTDREIKKREADLKKQPPVLYQDDSDEDDASSVYMRRKNYYEVPNLVGDGFEVAVVDETVADNQAEVEDHCKDSDDATISGLSSTSTITNYSNLNSDDILKEILRNQVDIKYSLKNLTKRIDQIDNVLKFTRGADVKSLEESPIISKLPLEESPIISKLPSGNVQDLLILENYIKETENFSNLVNFLYLVGGETEAKTIYYILRKLITNDVALQYSGIGKKGKLAFCKLDIYRAIVAATRMRHAKVTDEYIKKTVSTYLAQAKSRISNK